jgi:hypothetical protein
MVTATDISRSESIEDVGDISALLSKDSVIDVEIPMRGLLVRESIVISSCTRTQLEAQSSNISHFCTGTYNYPLFIKVRGTNKVVIGKMADLLVYKGKLRLNDFRVINQPWIDRQSERVQPQKTSFVILSSGGKRIRANLLDISTTGVCVLVPQVCVKEVEGFFDSTLSILIEIPQKKVPLRIDAEVAQIRSISDVLLRIGLHMHPKRTQIKILDRYLTDRKREILDEAYINFKDLLNNRGTKDLFF